MPDDELPPHVREKVRKLLSRGDKYRSLVERLLERRAAGSAEERSRVDEMLVSLAKPSRAGWWLALAGLMVGATLVMYLVSQHRYARAVAAGKPVLAQIQRLDSGSCVVVTKGFKCLRLALQLYPEGSEPYGAELTSEIDQQWLSRVQPGNWLTVSVARDDPRAVFFDERTMAVPPPKPPNHYLPARGL